MSKIIRGAGGGGGKGQEQQSAHVPTEAADTLRSTAYAQVLDLVSEGEIEGLVDGDKSIFLDGTALQNSDDSYNFTGVTVNTRYGTQSQNFIQGQSDVENELDVSTTVRHATGVTRTITNANVDAVRVTISFPQLTFQDPSSGDLVGTSVQFAIDVQSNGGGFVQKVLDTVSGKATSKYTRGYRIQLSGGAPYDIRVRRITEDSAAANLQNTTVFSSYTEIEQLRLSYPNSGLVALRVDAQQFNNIPARAYDLKLLKIRVPTNYDPDTRLYTGTWDGTFKIAWTDNPAWIFYDLVTSERYGLGKFILEAQVDKWTLYSVGKYCDEFVPDGFGGTEPRFTCNLYLQSRGEAYKVINDLASVFRAMVYWAAGALTVAQDAPQDAAFLFTPANVASGVFTYVGTSAKNRHTIALVTWNDPTDFYRPKVEYVEDTDGIVRYGAVETQVVAMGCTSRGQAHRIGKWILYTEKYQTETVQFQTGLEGALCRPGQVVKIADPVRAGNRRGGRIVTATTTAVTLDSDLPTLTGSKTLSVVLPDATVEDRAVSSILGRVVTVSSAYSSAPQNGSVWIIADGDVEPQEFRVLTVTEANPGTFDVTCIAHNSSKFDAIDNDTVLESRSISSLTALPDAPTALTVTETLYAVGKDVRNKVTVGWASAERAASYSVQMRRDSGNLESLGQTGSNSLDYLNAEPGFYEFWVTSISALGRRSSPSYITKTVVGRGQAPSDVQNFSMIPNANMAYLSWDKASDLDVLIGGTVRIRHTRDTTDPVWRNAVDIMPALPGSDTRAQAPLMPGTYLAKFVDASGVPSDNAAMIITTVPTALALNVVDTVTEDPSYAGTMFSMEYDSSTSGIILSATQVDDLVDIDAVADWSAGDGIVSEGTYLFANSVDLGSVYTSRVTVSMSTVAFDISDLLDDKIDLMDDWLDLDGAAIDDVNATVYLRTTEDDPADLAADWTPWKPFFVSDYRARGFEFKVVVTNGSKSHNLSITSLSVTVDMPDRSVNFAGLVSGTSTYNVVYDQPFKVVPAVGISGQNMNTGDYYSISSNTAAGFSIVFKNAAGTAVSRTFDVIAKGYGRVGV
jgi:predicted phage tail protein